MIKHSFGSKTMRKKILLIALLTVSAAALTTGCKKKHEKIDLSSTHTTAAETMTPETSAAETATETETEAISLDAAIENAANAGGSTGSGQGSATVIKNISTTVHTYSSGKVSIQYPSVTNLDDSARAEAINALLKKNALSVMDAYVKDEAKDSLEVTCKVLSADRSRITVTYTGIAAGEGAAHPVNVFYSNTVDVSKASSLRLPYFADPNLIAGYLLTDACVFPQISAGAKAEAQKVLAEHDAAYYANLLNQADFSSDGGFPSVFSYEYEGNIYVSIPVPHPVGDYVLIMYTPDNK